MIEPVSTNRHVWSGGRLISFDQAVWLMDKELFRQARDFVDFAGWCRKQEAEARLSEIIVIPQEFPQLDEVYWAKRIWDKYRDLHEKRYGVRFEPNLPTIPCPSYYDEWASYFDCDGSP